MYDDWYSRQQEEWNREYERNQEYNRQQEMRRQEERRREENRRNEEYWRSGEERERTERSRGMDITGFGSVCFILVLISLAVMVMDLDIGIEINIEAIEENAAEVFANFSAGLDIVFSCIVGILSRILEAVVILGLIVGISLLFCCCYQECKDLPSLIDGAAVGAVIDLIALCLFYPGGVSGFYAGLKSTPLKISAAVALAGLVLALLILVFWCFAYMDFYDRISTFNTIYFVRAVCGASAEAVLAVFTVNGFAGNFGSTFRVWPSVIIAGCVIGASATAHFRKYRKLVVSKQWFNE